jgi:hypothetical protein
VLDDFGNPALADRDWGVIAFVPSTGTADAPQLHQYVGCRRPDNLCRGTDNPGIVLHTTHWYWASARRAQAERVLLQHLRGSGVAVEADSFDGAVLEAPAVIVLPAAL